MALLDAVDGLTVSAGALGKSLLREVRVESCGPDALADGPPGGEDSGRGGRSGRHPLNGCRIMITCLYRGPYIYRSSFQPDRMLDRLSVLVRMTARNGRCRG